MVLEAALRWTEILLAFALLQQSAEHLAGVPRDRPVFALRLGLAALLMAGIGTAWVLLVLTGVALWLLHRFQGPYNGGSDRMGVLVLVCLTLARWVPAGIWQEAVFGYLALQLVLSYFISGQVKLMNPEWRSGAALRDVFAFSAYPVSDQLRGLAERRGLLTTMSWAVIGFEIVFPLLVFHPLTLAPALVVGACFHLANACLFGLNRFFWVWLSAYPSLWWLQDRLFAA